MDDIEYETTEEISSSECGFCGHENQNAICPCSAVQTSPMVLEIGGDQ